MKPVRGRQEETRRQRERGQPVLRPRAGLGLVYLQTQGAGGWTRGGGEEGGEPESLVSADCVWLRHRRPWEGIWCSFPVFHQSDRALAR